MGWSLLLAAFDSPCAALLFTISPSFFISSTSAINVSIVGLLTAASIFEMTVEPWSREPGGKSALLGVVGGDKDCLLSNDVVSWRFSMTRGTSGARASSYNYIKQWSMSIHQTDWKWNTSNIIIYPGHANWKYNACTCLKLQNAGWSSYTLPLYHMSTQHVLPIYHPSPTISNNIFIYMKGRGRAWERSRL